MLPYRDSRFTVIALVVFFAILIGYALYEARGALFGPTIDVIANSAEFHDPYVLIQGHAERISSLSMNGTQIRVTEDGQFAEPYLLAPGYNRIVLEAKDAYGRSTERVVEIMYGSASAPASSGAITGGPVASSTAPMAPGM